MTQQERTQRYENAKILAIRMHGIQEYDKFPYYKHLQDVENVLLRFGFNQYDDLIVCAWLHDILEDCPISYNDIKKEFGEYIAEVVFCVTDELGRNRKEKHSKTYPKICNNEGSLIVKLADRIANIENAKRTRNKIFEMYKQEHQEFKDELYPTKIFVLNVDSRIIEMFDVLDVLIK